FGGFSRSLSARPSGGGSCSWSMSVSAAGEFVERAQLAVRRAILIQERQLALVELAEELVPLDRLEILVVLVVVTWEGDSQQPDVLTLRGRLHVRGLPAPLLDPLANLVVIGRLLRFAHCSDLLKPMGPRSKFYATGIVRAAGRKLRQSRPISPRSSATSRSSVRSPPSSNRIVMRGPA